MSELSRRIDAEIFHRQLLLEAEAVLVAVSGGLDSIVLLHILYEIAPKHGWKLTVAHFNHLLRGRDAAADQKFVERAARRLGLRFESASADVRKFAREQKLSIEMAARKLRHDFLARSARGLGIKTVALAHHADDQVETFFLRLLRGAGSQGLGGMNWQAASPADPSITVVRPLLGITKAELIEFARSHRIRFRKDASNVSMDMIRNRIRGELLPLLRKRFQPGIDAVVGRTMELLREESSFASTEAQRWLDGKRRNFAALPVALQRRILQMELLRSGISVDFDRLEELRLNEGQWCNVNRELSCRRAADGKIETRILKPVSFRGDNVVIQLRGRSGETIFGVLEVDWSIQNGSGLPWRRGTDCEFLDADKLGRHIELRHWRAGDRFQPLGMSRPAKLQDIFVNQKIPRSRRHELVVGATAKGEIFWVEGLRIGEQFKLDTKTRRRLKWRWKRL